MPSVVIDANVLVSAVLKEDSTPDLAFRLARTHDVVCISDALLMEIEAVLRRPKLRSVVSPGRIELMLDLLVSRSFHLTPSIAVADCRDAKDNLYLELALEAGAWAIVSGDRDLLDLNPWRGVRIATAAEYVRLIGDRDGL